MWIWCLNCCIIIIFLYSLEFLGLVFLTCWMWVYELLDLGFLLVGFDVRGDG